MRGNPNEILVNDIYDRLRRMEGLHRHRKGKLEARLLELEEAVAEQALIYQALFRACLDQGLVRESEFLFLLRRLDLLDGVADGKWGRRKPAETAGRRSEGGGGKARKPQTEDVDRRP
jgi:hypothetical protein